IPPTGSRWASYAVNPVRLTGQTPYQVNVKFIGQMVPVNLLGDIAENGFDYNMSAKAIADNVVERSQTIWNRTVVLPPGPAVLSLRPTEREIMARPNKPFQSESHDIWQKPPAPSPAPKVADVTPLSPH
nr:hypothetical protein [Verrucomicrobiota bacterium]